MFDKKDITELMRTGLKIARKNANYKTGNLRYNAITTKRTKKGFDLTYNGQIADYWHFLETGTVNHNAFPHVSTTVEEINILLLNFLNNGKKTDVNRDFKMMKRYEKYLDKVNYENRSKVMEERNKLMYQSMLRAKGVVTK